MIVDDPVRLEFAQRVHGWIQRRATGGDRAGATRMRRLYHRWLAQNHYQEKWERPDDGGPYQMTGLLCTAGQTWGGA